MMIIATAALLAVGAVVFTLLIRVQDLPEDAGASPAQHLEDKKAQIYEALRDLNFESRVGKLSDEDYQKTKAGLQRDLAGVLAEIDAVSGGGPHPKPKKKPKLDGRLCPHCGAKFEQAMKFVGLLLIVEMM